MFRVGRKSLGMMAGLGRRVEALGSLSWRLVDLLRRHGARLGGDWRYEEFFRNLPVGMYRSTAEGRFVDVNPTLARMLGYESERELMGVPVWSLYWNASDRQRWMELVERHGVLKDFEVRLRRKDGSPLWVRENCRTVRGPDGRVVFLEGTVEDITERKMAEEALAESEERYRTLIERQGEGLAIVDSEERFLFCNRVTAEMFGATPEELEGQSLRAFVTEEEFQRLREETAKRRRGLRSTYRISITRPDGERRRLLVTATPWYDREGRFVGAFGILRDVTEEEAALEALRASEEKYRAVVNQSADAIFLLDGDEATFLEANPATSLLLDVPQGSLVGRPLSEFVRASKQDLLDTLQRLQEQGSAVLGEWEFERPDGETRVAEVSASLVRYGGREVVCVVARDVTDRKAAERALQETQDQIRRMQMLDLVGQLAGGVAHDFNNIMAGILGYCRLLLRADGNLDPQVKRSIGAIQDLAERAAGLTQQLLAFSRRQSLATKVFDLADVVADVEGLLRHLVGDQVELQVEIARDRSTLRGDPGQVEQVLLNLVLNARDAIEGRGLISIRVADTVLDRERVGRGGRAAPGRYVELTVRDTGVGIPPELLDKIFEPFFTTKERGRGSGLGLATVYGIVRQHGGWMDVESELGQGTTFRVCFPALEPVEARDEPHGDHPAPEASRMPLLVDESGPRGWVLVVCPDPRDRANVAGWLRGYGFSVVEASDVGEGRTAFEVLEGDLDVVLLDVRVDGWRRLAEDLRKEDPAIRFVFGGWPEDVPPMQGAVGIPLPYRRREVRDALGHAVESTGTVEFRSSQGPSTMRRQDV